MGANYTSSLLDYYKRQNRSIKEQVLNFNFNENYRLYNYLLNNYKPQNRYYLYDFFYDNCATKIKDVSNKALDYKIPIIYLRVLQMHHLEPTFMSKFIGIAGADWV